MAAGLVLLAALVAYHNSFSVPFLFDDDSSIKDNPTIRSLWHAWWPPTGSGVTVGGRPLLNFSFALNHAVSGREVWSYHAFNLLIHAGAGLVLFGVVRRTLRQPVLAPRFSRDATALALAVALLWTVHPLQTESVTYVVQRAESLVGLLYLLTLWCFIRAFEPDAARGWKPLAFACCLLGMAAKEVMVTAPLLVALYDRIFMAGSWREAARRRGWFHLSVFGTWLILVGLLLASGNRGGTAGLGTASSLDYALTQVGAIVHYLRLAFWPDPLVFDYGTAMVTDPAWVLPAALVLVPLVAASLWAAWRGRPAGFCGLFFFGVLAPSSSVVPVLTQTMAEHRMYLPLAAVIALSVTLLYTALGRKSWAIFTVLAVVLTGATVRRNVAYRSERAIWADTVSNRPENARARLALGLNFARDPACQAEAIAEYQAILRLHPDDPEAHVALGNLYFNQPDQTAKAIVHYQAARRLSPATAGIHHNLANALLRLPDHRAEAIKGFRTALRLDPKLPDVHFHLASALAEDPAGIREAAKEFEETLRLDPDNGLCHYNFALLLARQPGRTAEAITHYEAAVRLLPDCVPARFNLGLILAKDPQRVPEAVSHYEYILKIDPANDRARRMLEKLQRAPDSQATPPTIGT
jgi:cytochrome c-type biogenesis protein CcmH/NrfG